jgi:hypothetical protein
MKQNINALNAKISVIKVAPPYSKIPLFGTSHNLARLTKRNCAASRVIVS